MELSGICVDGVFTPTIDRVNQRREEMRNGKVETTKLLEQFSEDLLEKASSMEPIIGREREMCIRDSCDDAHGASVGASAALDASVSDLVSHARFLQM